MKGAKRMRKARSIRRISELGSSSEASRPNYMKPTTSSGARKERLRVSFEAPTTCANKRSPSIPSRSRVYPSSSSSSAPSSNNDKTITSKRVRPATMKIILVRPLFPKGNASRATCSSTIKDSRFPKKLELGPGATESEGASAKRVCPHTYCSLNDAHGHEPLPPLNTLLSSRRRLQKTQESMWLKSFGRRVSDKPISVPTPRDEVDDDFSVVIYAKPSANDDDDVGPGRITSVGEFGKSAEIKISNRSSDECYSELSFEENPEVESAEMNGQEENNANLEGNDFEGHVLDLPAPNSPEVELAEMIEDAENGNSDLETECVGGMHGDEDEVARAKSESKEPEGVRHMATEKEEEVECHGDTESSELDGDGENNTSATKNNTKLTYTRKTVEDDREEPRAFNPRAPNILPAQPDPEDERVDLRHQATDDRKNAEEWMIDCALQRVVGRLAPDRKRKVELLVEAFETVCEPQHDDHGSGVFPHTGPIQAFS